MYAYAGTSVFMGASGHGRWLALLAAVVWAPCCSLGDPAIRPPAAITPDGVMLECTHVSSSSGHGHFSRSSRGVLSYIAVIQVVRLPHAPAPSTAPQPRAAARSVHRQRSGVILLFRWARLLWLAPASGRTGAFATATPHNASTAPNGEACAIDLERSHRTGQPLALQ